MFSFWELVDTISENKLWDLLRDEAARDEGERDADAEDEGGDAVDEGNQRWEGRSWRHFRQWKHDSSMVATQVGTVRHIVCGSPSYFAANGVPKTPRDLQKLSFITFDVLNPGTSWSFGGKRGEVMPIRSRLSVNTAEAAIDAGVAGVGVTRVLSYQAARAIEDGKLQVVLGAFEPAPVPVSVIANQGLLPLKIRSFLDFAVPLLRTRSQLADRAKK